MKRTVLAACLGTLLLPLASVSSRAAGPTFEKDQSFTGQDVAGAKPVGGATWRAQDGEIVGRATKGAGGFLVLPAELVNLAGYAEFRCDKACAAGVLFRVQPTPAGGLKGILVSASPVGGGAFALELDAKGHEVARTPLKKGESYGGLPNPWLTIPKDILESIKEILKTPEVDVPGISKATGAYLNHDWNAVNFVAYGDMLKPSLNGAPGSQYLPDSLMPDEAGGYGAVALYVGGSGSVHFRNVLLKDLNRRRWPAEVTSKNFKKQQLDALYFSWGPAVGDFNKDGKPDILAGPYYWEGPTFEVSHEIYTPVEYNPASDFPQKSFINLVYDFNKDGWDDVLTISGNAGISTVTLYLNPKGESRHWDSCVVLKPIGNEETLFEDIDGDGKPELIHAAKTAMAYSTWDEKNPCSWTTTIVSEPGPWGSFIGHGIGVGDINGDGRKDIVSAYGWFEQPVDRTATPWKFHPQAFGRRGESQGGAGGAQLGIYDVNGDGLADVVTPLEGHGFGLAWYEQKKGADGSPTFVQHMIMDGFLDKNAGGVMFTEPHASAYADIDGDGIKDLITGKRYMSHLTGFMDPDPFGVPVLYVYKVVRNPNAPGGAEFVPELIDNRSGVGSHIDVSDVNGDGKPDIVVSGALGTFLFINQEGSAKR